MSNNEWVQEGTPRDAAEWTEETDDYGVPVEPAEWDDYSAEQAMPVPSPPAQSERPRPQEPEQPQAPEVDHATMTTAPDPDDAAAGTDEPVSTVELGETPEEVAGVDEPVHDEPVADVDGTEATVFADDRPVDQADEDVTREVAEGIDQERTEYDHEDLDHPDDEPTVSRIVEEEHTGYDERMDDDPVFEDGLQEEPVHVDPVDDEPFHSDDEPDRHDDVHVDDTERADVDRADGYDDLEATALNEAPFHEDGGSTAVDPDAVEEAAEHDDVRREDAEAPVFGRSVDPDPATTPAAPAPVGAAAAAAGAPAAMAGLYRTDGDETQVIDTRRSVEDEAAEEEARAAALRAEREERERRLGIVRTSDENAERELRPRRRGVGPFGSFGLFVLRLVTAAILGIVAYQVLYSIDATTEFLSRQALIPEPRLVSWIIGFTLAAMAVMLVIGLGVRVVGLLLAVIAIAALVLIRWGSFSPFVDGMEGFLGDKDLLLAGVGIAFLSLGGGRFGVDGAISRSREEARELKRN